MDTSTPVHLTAGELAAVYRNGELRPVYWGEQVVLQRLYVAVRDKNWGTIPGEIVQSNLQIVENDFTLTQKVVHKEKDIHFEWQGVIQGTSNNTLTFEIRGKAHSSFYKNRIGFCLLHPAEQAGHRCVVEHTDGTQSSSYLPETISADQPLPPFANMRSLAIELQEGANLFILMEGDIFEMEDQRNWTDASFKTYSTPLHLPFPVFVPAGTTLYQRITLQMHTSPLSARKTRKQTTHTTCILQLGCSDHFRLPAVGFGVPDEPCTLPWFQIERLRQLNPQHVRIELNLQDPNWPQSLAIKSLWVQKLSQASSPTADTPPNLPVEIALLFSDSLKGEVKRLVKELAHYPFLNVARWLALPLHQTPSTPPPYSTLLETLREILDNNHCLIGTGTNSDFLFINRYPPPMEQADFLAFAINPQVHAWDDLSLMENLSIQSTVVENAYRIAKGKPLEVAPITLKPRFNPYATTPEPTPPPDPRQQTLFGALWSLGSLCSLLQSPARYLIYYELAGAKGLLSHTKVFPTYFVFADLARYLRGTWSPVPSSHPKEVCAMALTAGEKKAVLVGNLCPVARQIRLEGLGGNAKAYFLVHETAEDKALKREVSLTQALLMEPYSYGCIEWE